MWDQRVSQIPSKKLEWFLSREVLFVLQCVEFVWEAVQTQEVYPSPACGGGFLHVDVTAPGGRLEEVQGAGHTWVCGPSFPRAFAPIY